MERGQRLNSDLRKKLKNLIDNPISFWHPRLNYELRIARVKGSKTYQLSLVLPDPVRPVDSLPLSDMETATVSEIRKSTVIIYANETVA